MHSNNNQPKTPVPNLELFNRIRACTASIPETQAYFQALDQYLDRCTPQDPNYSIITDHYFRIEQILEGANALPTVSASYAQELEFKVDPTPATSEQLERTYQKHKSAQELEAEILAAATSGNSELELTRLAASQGRPYSVVEALAKALLKTQGLDSKFDLSKSNYERCIQEIREIELKEDPGEKSWKLYDLARKYGRSKDEMLDTYYRSLLTQHLEDPISLKDYVSKFPSGRRWLLRGWIPESSLVLFYGHGGIGKTLFTHHLVKHICQGINWEEYRVRSGGSGILYIQTDTALSTAVEALRQAGIPNDVPIQIHGKWRMEFMHYLYKWIEQQRPALVIIDSLTSVNRFSTINENDSKYAQPILQLRDIAAEFNCSFLIIHHANGAGEMRGTKAVRAAVDEVWRIEKSSKDESDPKRTLVIEKSRSRATGRYEIQFDDENFSWDLLEPEEGDGKSTINKNGRWLIVNHLHKHPGVKFWAEDLAQAIGIPEATVRRELPALAREGVIDRELNPKHNYNSKGIPKYFYLISV